MERQVDLARLLPDDVLVEVLRRVAPRSLAVSRCVCRAWRALIDDRGMLHADLLPHSLSGLFISYMNRLYAKFFARPSLDYGYRMPNDTILDHCNGLLLLYDDWLYNPATDEVANLPELPTTPRAGMEFVSEQDVCSFLAFDPTVSSHYEVFLIPSVPCEEDIVKRAAGSAVLHSEWPPSPCILSVFSSRTGLWEDRSFSRQGEAAGTEIPSLIIGIYVSLCKIMIISSSNSTYRVIKPPIRGTEVLTRSKYPEFFLGRSEKGIYYALLDDNHRLRVWILDESCDQTQWKLRQDTDLGPFPSLSGDHGPWVLENVSSDYESKDEDEYEEQMEEEFEWISDDDNIPPTNDMEEKCDAVMRILAFHPYKEIIFLDRSSRVLAYHLSSSKLEALGNLLPNFYVTMHIYVCSSFPYTPCWMRELLQTFK
ncbi:hypothetical protein GQ55_9G189800 [Panicum hallii var. hallii]|uniref:F-box domain-containing protein n=1 Tax=Panicum hallii var. hallii TaxID=1504633 RepID=A0A2T7C4T8_9POAL|nr:hypothetical protein GQ55_9G189800 [Panicum hallii var. hallii]